MTFSKALYRHLAAQSPEQLRNLIERLAIAHPEVKHWLESELNSQQIVSKEDAKSASMRNKIRQHLIKPARFPQHHPSFGANHTPWDELEAYALRAQEQLEAENYSMALAILEEVSESYFKYWYVESVEMSEYGEEASDFVQSLSELWVEAILHVAISKSQRQKWHLQLQAWQSQLAKYAQEDCLQSVLEALDV